jgi:hypothetical protein
MNSVSNRNIVARAIPIHICASNERALSKNQHPIYRLESTARRELVSPAAAMDAVEFESLLEGMLQLRLDPPQDSDGVSALPEGVTDQPAAAVPAQPAAAAENKRVDQSAGEWAELIVTQMVSATSEDDARCRAARILEAFGGSVCSRVGQVLGEKDRVLAAAMEKNSILKRAVVAQHRRHLQDEEKSRELRCQVVEYRERVKRLEADNYVLSMHLRNTGPAGSSMPGNFHPEVF